MNRSEAVALYNKITDSNVPLGLFKEDKTVKAIKINANIYQKAVKAMKDDFIGVYDFNCPFDDFEEDLKYLNLLED